MTSRMWKPGTARPKASTKEPTPEPSSQSGSEEKLPGVTTEAVPKKKTKLSGATMGMRFMQRKAEAMAAGLKRRVAEKKAETVSQLSEAANLSQRSEAIEDGQSISNDDAAALKPQVATAVDMYGIGAEIIGRRAFGGFNKTVSDSWENSLVARERNRFATKAEKQTISDDELLKRYEKYVRGKGDGEAVGPIGNLKEKAKKRKNQNEQRQEKRRRT
eukprot:scaffold37981_cov50-Attheya_sp.AAC.7